MPVYAGIQSPDGPRLGSRWHDIASQWCRLVLLSGCPAIDDQLAPGDKRRFIGGEI
jgi:hypothetical protein